MWEVIDTFDDFLSYWGVACSKTLTQQIELWQTSYMIRYPELLEKQVQDYKNYGLDWREIAKDKVFPKMPDYLQLMQEARENLLKVCGAVYERASQVLGLDFDVTFVIYVGIGCGAGWATQYNNGPACLFGLEKIAELKWYRKESLRGLTAHELGHLVHMGWRNEWDSFTRNQRNPLFLLYSEGFAERCEHLILEVKTWREAPDKNWLLWSRQHKAWIAGEYLRRVYNGLPVNDFFGDWLNVQGKSQIGYFLGYEFVRWLEKEHSIREIATLSFENVKEQALSYLRSIASALA